MSLLQTYREKLRDGSLKPDAAQARVVEKLSEIADHLNRHPPGRPGFISRLLRRPADVPMGIYLHGEVGRGKTMLMDMFFDAVKTWPKRRVHFHAFMQEIHATRARLGGDSVISATARDIAASARLLCLDEMQITDIADAMIIGRLYEALLENGVVLVTTANPSPAELYRDGLNRQLFLPFITRLTATMDVIALEGPRDYRLGRIRTRETFLYPATADNRVAFNTLWRDLTDGAAGIVEILDVLGRKRTVPKASHGCASFTFYELCGEALGPPDYLAIAKAYQTIFISGVTPLKSHQRNEMRRFIVMIDTFHDLGTRIVALADAPPEKLFPKNQHSVDAKRAISRLKEMQSVAWWGSMPADT